MKETLVQRLEKLWESTGGQFQTSRELVERAAAVGVFGVTKKKQIPRGTTSDTMFTDGLARYEWAIRMQGWAEILNVEERQLPMDFGFLKLPEEVPEDRQDHCIAHAQELLERPWLF